MFPGWIFLTPSGKSRILCPPSEPGYAQSSFAQNHGSMTVWRDVEARNAQVPTLALATAPSDKCRVAHVPGCTRPTVKITHMQLRVGWDDDPQQRVYLRCLNCLNGWKRQARKALRLCPVYCTDPSFSALCMGCAGAELQGSRSLFMTPLLHRHGVETDAAEPGRCGGFRDTTCEKVSGCFPRSVCRL